MIERFNHMGITVANIERSIEFYCGSLGLELPPDGHIFTIEGEWLGKLVGADEPEIRVAFVPLDHGVLELLEYHNPATGKQAASLENWDVGSSHLALNLVGVVDFYEANKHALQFVSAPQIVASGPWSGGYVVYLHDPDGNSVELVDVQPES